jgi:hypothetical protein|tara:strand:- start:42 stop:371 length:330 start_codon:yes stop_codon:yes gene_type:complete
MKKLILISALMFSFNGWTTDCYEYIRTTTQLDTARDNIKEGCSTGDILNVRAYYDNNIYIGKDADVKSVFKSQSYDLMQNLITDFCRFDREILNIKDFDNHIAFTCMFK